MHVTPYTLTNALVVGAGILSGGGMSPVSGRLLSDQATAPGRRLTDHLDEMRSAIPSVNLAAAQTPNDPDFSRQWHFNPVQFAVNDVLPVKSGANILEAHKYSEGENVIVGLLSHETGREASYNEDQAQTSVALPKVWGSISSNNYIFDKGQFTTNGFAHTQGLITAIKNNGLTTAGVAPKSLVVRMPLPQTLEDHGVPVPDRVRWLAGLPVNGAPENLAPAKVIAFHSFISEGECAPELQQAINEVVAAGTTVVVGAGLTGEIIYSPATCSNVLTTSGIKHDGTFADITAHGPSINILAPAGEPLPQPRYTVPSSGLSVHPDDDKAMIASTSAAFTGYVLRSGIQPAIGITAGVVALLKSINPALTQQQVIDILGATAAPLNAPCPFGEGECGPGRLNALAAAEMALSTLTPVNPPVVVDTNTAVDGGLVTPTPVPTPTALPAPAPAPSTDFVGAVPDPIPVPTNNSTFLPY